MKQIEDILNERVIANGSANKKYTQVSVVIPADMLRRISTLPVETQKRLKKSLVAIYENLAISE